MPSVYIRSSSTKTPWEILKDTKIPAADNAGNPLTLEILLALMAQGMPQLAENANTASMESALLAPNSQPNKLPPDMSLVSHADTCNVVVPNDCADKWSYADAYIELMPRNIPKAAKFKGFTCQATCVSYYDLNANSDFYQSLVPRSAKANLRNLASWQGVCACSQRPNNV